MKSFFSWFFALLYLLLFSPIHSHGSELVGVDFSSAGAYDYITLRKGSTFAKQLQKAHTIYEIKYDYDLRGETVQVPSDCILKFEGGHLTNGCIVFNKTIVEAANSDVFDQITVSGSLANHKVWLSWWKLMYDEHSNDAILINQVIDAIDNCILYYDIKDNIYVGTDKTEGSSEETIAFLNKQNLTVIQPTQYYTILRGRSSTGSVLRCINNKYILLDGLKVDGGNVYYKKWGENGIGVVGNKKVLIENCIIRNCFSNCFDKEANGKLLNNGYPEWGAGGKGIQIEGGKVQTQAMIRNNSISNCYIGISNNASHQENIIMDGNYIDSCYMSLILLRLNENIEMNVVVDNTIIANNTGDVGVICLGNPQNVCISNTQIKGSSKTKSILRGCFSYSIIQLLVNQPCDALIDAALYRDNPEGHWAKFNFVRIISNQSCDNIITTSEIIPKRGGSSYVEFMGGEFDITLSGKVNKTPIVLPNVNKTSVFNVRYGAKILNGDMETINKKR